MGEKAGRTMATIKDVAKQAGVSVATVSRVLNNNGYVNEDTRNKVNLAIKQLNYQPSDVARSLFKRRSKMIGLIVPDITNPFFPELARAIEDVTNEAGYTFVLCNSDNELEKEEQYMNALKQKYIDGFIVVSSTLTEERVKELDIPVVALDRIISPHMPTVNVKNYEGAKLAVQHLLETGCKKIAHVAGPDYVDNARSRKQGYLDAVGKCSWFHEELIVDGKYGLDAAKEAATFLLTTYRDIDGIFVGNDLMAVGVLKAAEALNIHVPNDVSVIGFDGIAIGKTTTPGLTTVAQPIYDVGSKAANLLLNYIDGKQTTEQNITFDVELVERESTIRR